VTELTLLDTRYYLGKSIGVYSVKTRGEIASFENVFFNRFAQFPLSLFDFTFQTVREAILFYYASLNKTRQPNSND